MFTETGLYNETPQLRILIAAYKRLINAVLPAAYTYPVKYNHCFARIVLDWLFQDCWYNCLSRNKPAVNQLTEPQLKAAISRMTAWLHDQNLLIADNKASLDFRKRIKQKQYSRRN